MASHLPELSVTQSFGLHPELTRLSSRDPPATATPYRYSCRWRGVTGTASPRWGVRRADEHWLAVKVQLTAHAGTVHYCRVPCPSEWGEDNSVALGRAVATQSFANDPLGNCVADQAAGRFRLRWPGDAHHRLKCKEFDVFPSHLNEIQKCQHCRHNWHMSICTNDAT
jgi:hypothetical protein